MGAAQWALQAVAEESAQLLVEESVGQVVEESARQVVEESARLVVEESAAVVVGESPWVSVEEPGGMVLFVLQVFQYALGQAVGTVVEALRVAPAGLAEALGEAMVQ